MKTKIYKVNYKAGKSGIEQDVIWDNATSEVTFPNTLPISLDDLRNVCERIVSIQPSANEILRIIQD